MARKTREEVQIEVAALKELRPQMPSYARGIDVTLQVLENGLSSDAVFDVYEGDEQFEDAHAALLWRDGNGGDAPSVHFCEML